MNTNDYVPPEGPVPCDVMFIGEAPGENEVRLKRPFVGNAGIILNDALRESGFKRREVYITNACLCRPPGNRTPTKEEMICCRPRLIGEINKVGPRIIILLGRTAYTALTSLQAPTLKMMHGHVMQLAVLAEELGNVAYVMYTYHPQATCYSGVAKVYFKQDLKKAKQILSGVLIP